MGPWLLALLGVTLTATSWARAYNFRVTQRRIRTNGATWEMSGRFAFGNALLWLVGNGCTVLALVWSLTGVVF